MRRLIKSRPYERYVNIVQINAQERREKEGRGMLIYRALYALLHRAVQKLNLSITACILTCVHHKTLEMHAYLSASQNAHESRR